MTSIDLSAETIVWEKMRPLFDRIRRKTEAMFPVGWEKTVSEESARACIRDIILDSVCLEIRQMDMILSSPYAIDSLVDTVLTEVYRDISERIPSDGSDACTVTGAP